MKITKKQLKRIIKEELAGTSHLKEFWGKKKPPAPTSSDDWKKPLTTASNKMGEVVQALWGLHDNPPRPDLLEKAIELMKELKSASKEEQ